jgi:cation diffusion facilitator CzcD-associated flavoprotein CzcO
MENLADDFGVRPHIHFNHEVTAATWDDTQQRWRVQCTGGVEFDAKYVIAATGQLHRPRTPDIPGAATFSGAQFHTARFDHTVALEGARVAIIGSGASSIQVAPAIAAGVSHLDVYQRSAPYVMPKDDPSTSTWQRIVQRTLPWLTRVSRARAYVFGELFGAGLVGRSVVRDKARGQWEMYVNAVVKDPELRSLVEPDYEIGCKRVLLASDWYSTLQRDNVSLVTSDIERMTSSGIVTRDGTERPYDVIIYATGFESTEFLAPMAVFGRNGVDLRAIWGRRPLAHRGVTVPGFPNFFVLYGPNTNLGSNSILFMLESQFGYVRRLVESASSRGWAVVEVTPEALEQWRHQIDEASQDTAWLQGCQSWYTVDGVNTNNWPFSSWRYHQLLGAADLENYQAPPLPGGVGVRQKD